MALEKAAGKRPLRYLSLENNRELDDQVAVRISKAAKGYSAAVEVLLNG